LDDYTRARLGGQHEALSPLWVNLDGHNRGTTVG